MRRETAVGSRARAVGACGEAPHHARVCGDGLGVFLLLRKTVVLFLRGERCATWHSPYLDAHGEEDENLRRGKPLYLSRERVEALTAMVRDRREGSLVHD